MADVASYDEDDAFWTIAAPTPTERDTHVIILIADEEGAAETAVMAAEDFLAANYAGLAQTEPEP